MTPPRRSALYMPASNVRAIEKARSLPCDVVILDLEDAVAPDAKLDARANAVAALRAGGFGARELVVRVNGLDTPWGREDLRAVCDAGARAVLVPKVSTAEEVRACDAALPAAVELWIMVETCRAMLRLEEIADAAAGTRLSTLVFGSNDLAKEMGCRLDVQREALRPALFMLVAAARMRGLAVLDGVFNDIDDEAGLVMQCAQGAAHGFHGKTLIHPKQVEHANQAFSPAPSDVEWARVVVNAFSAADAKDKGVLRVDGRMVERLHLAQAHALLAVAEAIAARTLESRPAMGARADG